MLGLRLVNIYIPYRCAAYSLAINKFNPPPFADGFKNALKLLHDAVGATEAEKDQISKDFFDEYGTHFMDSLIMGARIAVTSRFTESEWGRSKETDVKKCNADAIKVMCRMS